MQGPRRRHPEPAGLCREFGTAFSHTPQAAAIAAGFAELATDETATQLIARADSELIDHRHSND